MVTVRFQKKVMVYQYACVSMLLKGFIKWYCVGTFVFGMLKVYQPEGSDL